MATEIELKARVADQAHIQNILTSYTESTGTYHKRDQYWRREGLSLGSGVRIRKEDASSPGGVINFKEKEVRSGIEVNDEHEFEVSDTEEFGLLLSRLGLSPWIRKDKRGTAWKLDGILVELSEIEGLGWYVELEILEDRDDPETVAAARKRLLACLEKIGLHESDIESRYYTEMLASRPR